MTTAKKCTKSYDARAQPWFCSLNLLFSDVPVDVVVLLNSIIFRCKISVKYSFKQITVIVGGCTGEGKNKNFLQSE